jgi:ligand-binding sensor domain-containing protein
MFLLCSGYVISQSKPLADFNANGIRAGKDEYMTKVLGAKDGLPSSEILTIIQDEYGFVWIGTSFGVSRYDGFTFTNFLTCGNRQLGKTFGIVCDTTQHLIWIMSDAGLCYYSNGRLHEIIIKENDMAVYSLCIDQRNNYWLATSKGPAYLPQTAIPAILQTGNINIDEHILPAWKTFTANKESIKKITTTNGDNIYFNSSNAAYSSDKKNINLIWQVPSSGDKIVSILSVSPNRVYFSSILTGIHAYSNQTVSSVSTSASISANLFAAGNNIHHLNAKGIHRLDTLNNALQIISTIPDNENKWLSCLMVDREDNLWIGMHHTLIFQQKKLFHTYNNIQAPEGSEFFSICKKKE